MIYSDKAIDYSAGFTIQPDGTMKPNKIGTYVMTNEECQALHSDMCWDGSDWSAEDLKDNDEWFKETQRRLSQ